MKNLNARELEIVRWISQKGHLELTRLKDLLESQFFTSQSNRCLIIQPIEKYAMYFIDVTQFNDDSEKAKQVGLFIELMSLLHYLDSQGFITVFRGEHGINEKIFAFSELFTLPKIEGKKIVLNAEGMHSTRPETIKDKNGEVVYKGVELKGSHYEMAFRYCTGDICVSPAINDLLRENEGTNHKRREREVHHSKASWAIVLAATLTIIAVLTVTYLDTRWRLNRLSSHVETSQKLMHMSKENPIVGIDISRWNGNALANDELINQLNFVIVKATQGETEIDPLFEGNWQKLGELGKTKGAYHFYVAGQNPTIQAEHFWAQLGTLSSSDIAPIVDVERASFEGNKAIDDYDFQLDLMLFIKKLEQLSGVTPMIYSSTSFADKYITHSSFSDYPLWLADYTDAMAPTIPIVWKEQGYAIWQKSDSYQLGSSKFDFDVASKNFSLF